MFLSLSNEAKFSVDAVGVYFSKDSVLTPIGSPVYLLPYIPQIENGMNNFLADTLNWTNVNGIFVAKGEEGFITIGNFKDDTNTGKILANGNGYSYYFIDDVSIVELPEASELTGGNKTICAGDSVQLGTAQKLNVSYTWEGSGLVGSSGNWQWVKPGATTTYTLVVSDTSVICPNSSMATVIVTVTPCDTSNLNNFWVPTAFSPNNDNNNDILYVYGKNIKDMEFSVYDRWGEKIFETKEPGKGWDGKINNTDAPESVYVWYANVKFKDGEERIYKGNITLVK